MKEDTILYYIYLSSSDYTVPTQSSKAQVLEFEQYSSNSELKSSSTQVWTIETWDFG